LQAAGTTVAMKCDIRSREMTFGLRTAYDERFAKASPGVQIEIDAVSAFHASGVRFADWCTNHGKNPQRWLWPDTRPLRCHVVTLGGVIGRITTSRLAWAARRLATGTDAPRRGRDVAATP
jgi:CelD/BcsL family acetyltransferase involved in cellulose biosynthesis